MEIKTIKSNKKDFLELLLLADPQENMIDKYLDRGELFALYDGDLKCICVVTQEDEEVYEIKNLATYEQYQRKGYGKSLVNYIFQHYKGKGKTILVGTGDSPLTLPFYKKCGFVISHIEKDFFTRNYEEAIFEEGIQLIDMVYLKRDL